MSLDRQRILSELGSVMNQLKSADCGCMGKLFSNEGQGQAGAMGAPLPTCGGCRRGFCHGHGYSPSTPCSGEPHSMGHSMNHSMNQPCMGHCNPPKLYADTYSYLNNNLMQPVVKEVYDDLKSINPGNTIMNNPLGNQMGLAGNSGGMAPGNAGNASNPMANMSSMDSGNANMSMGQQPQQQMNPMAGMGGMGPQIVNMIMGDSGRKPSNVQRIPAQGSQPGTMGNAPQMSTPAHGGAMSMSPEANQGQYGANMGYIGQQGNMGGFANPPTQYVSKENMYSKGAVQDNPTMSNVGQSNAPFGNLQMASPNNALVPGNAQMGGLNTNVQQMSAPNQYGQNSQGMMRNVNPGAQQIPSGNQQQYGQHTRGITKFNEMFPGVMQGGDLGFDPMAIAIQMNPANQQKAAMDAMQKLMNGGPANKVMDTAGDSGVMKPVMDATKNAVESVNPALAAQGQQNVAYNNQVGNQQLAGQQQPIQQNIPQAQTMNQQMNLPGQQQAPINPPASGSIPPQTNAVPPQQVYTAITGQPIYNQQQYQQQQNQQYVDPNTGTPLTQATPPTGQERMVDPYSQTQQPDGQAVPEANVPPPQPMIREPIFPADTSRNRPMTYSKRPQKYYNYNTLGQPVEMLPADMFHAPEPSLPQTLSPQAPSNKLRNDYANFSNVKSTVSKTSLAGNRPVGRIPSRSQLKHIYNQYKGSQSFTQQNTRPPVQGGTFSDGKLNVPPSNAHAPQQVPVERVGGDTAANNQRAYEQISNKVEQVMGQVGDVPVLKKAEGDSVPSKVPPPSPMGRHGKLRNGLQDVVYTSYPTSAAWSFHGTNTYQPISVGYKFRNMK